MLLKKNSYPATLDVDYPKQLDRLTSFFRLVMAIPIVIILSVITATGSEQMVDEAGKVTTDTAGGIVGGLFVATLLMILFRQRYPRWWFDFALELKRFTYRVGSYVFLLTDRYPSTTDEQAVHLNVKYPNVEKDLNRWLPLVKWILALPHFLVLIALVPASLLATIIAWFAILFTGRYPRSLFDFVVGVGRWSLRVDAYAFMLTTDKYPPFSLR